MVEGRDALRAEHVAGVAFDAPHDLPGGVVLLDAPRRPVGDQRPDTGEILRAPAERRRHRGVGAVRADHPSGVQRLVVHIALRPRSGGIAHVVEQQEASGAGES